MSGDLTGCICCADGATLHIDSMVSLMKCTFARRQMLDSLLRTTSASQSLLMLTRFAYIDFLELTEAQTALNALDRQVFEGRRLSVQFAVPRASGVRRSASNMPKAPPSRTLFIGNMSFELSDQDLNDLFKNIKNVLDVRVAIDRRTGQPRGFAHADFTDIESAQAAMKQLEGKELYGRTLRVDFSAPSARTRIVT